MTQRCEVGRIVQASQQQKKRERVSIVRLTPAIWTIKVEVKTNTKCCKTTVKLIIGLYCLCYSALWVLQRHLPLSGKGCVFALLLLTFAASFGIFYHMLKGRLSFLRITIVVAGALAVAFVVTIATLFDPVTTRPSPIPLNEESLDILAYVLHIGLAILGGFLVWQSLVAAGAKRTM